MGLAKVFGFFTLIDLIDVKITLSFYLQNKQTSTKKNYSEALLKIIMYRSETSQKLIKLGLKECPYEKTTKCYNQLNILKKL